MLNIFYFSRELLYKQLFSEAMIVNSETPVSVNQEPISSFPLLKNESDNLPENIKKLFEEKRSTNYLNPSDLSLASDQGESFLKAIQKAEKLIDDQIKLLQSRQILKKSEIDKVQEEIKDELARTLPEVPKEEEEWINWSPLKVQDKLLSLEIYCEICGKTISLKDSAYEIVKKEGHFLITSNHGIQNNQHSTIAKVTLDTFEILSKPTVTNNQTLEVEA